MTEERTRLNGKNHNCTYLQAQNWADWAAMADSGELARGVALLPASTAGPAAPWAGLGAAEVNGLLAWLATPAGAVD